MSKDNSFRTRQHVKWKWGNGEGRGQITERFERDVERTLNGSQITRHGTSDNPAYPTWNDMDRSEVHVVGRVIWFGRAL